LSFVLDASVALAWCFRDEQTDALLALQDRLVRTGAFAPPLWPLEVLNRLLTAERRSRIDTGTRRELSLYLSRLPVRLEEGTAEQAWTGVAQLATQHGLTAYDAAYLELASRLGLPLATLDRQLIVAARASNVEALGAS
jgi:predicted nucleic acid-binding protein